MARLATATTTNPYSQACDSGGANPSSSAPSRRPNRQNAAGIQITAWVRASSRATESPPFWARHCRKACTEITATLVSSMARLAQSGDGSHHRASASAHSRNRPATDQVRQLPISGRGVG